ncbi:hypothetical protein [Nonomuraea sp. NPDC052265]|uniref:hypothetical protein n=1 Tax=Nonomuraea sp. NPDC052265 TaxID=3364374 RepID=UPI0037C5CCB4
MTGLLDVRRIYVEPEAAALPRGREVLARFPAAEIVEVESHHRIPELYGDEANVARWVRIKTEALKYVNRDLLGWDPRGHTRVRFSLMPAAGYEVHVNLGWHPKAEEVPWRPELQWAKRWETGGWSVRYRNGHKGRCVAALTGLLAARLPYCRVRYAF